MKSRALPAGMALLVIAAVTVICTLVLPNGFLFAEAGNGHAPDMDWCAEHRVPESECTQCNPALIDRFKAAGDWCAGHALPESHCRLCNPELRFPQENQFDIAAGDVNDDGNVFTESELDWCVEHSVPESECTRCNPSLIEQYKASGDWCVGHGLPESHCRACNPGLAFPQEEILRAQTLNLAERGIEVSLIFRPNVPVCATDGALIQLTSAEIAGKAGISTQQVIAAPYETVIEAPAEIVFDESNKTVVTVVIPALVTRWLVSPGDPIHQGDALAVLQSPNMAELQANLLSAFSEYQVQKNELDRHEALKSRNLISAGDYERHLSLAEQAHSRTTSARGLLLSAGISDADIMHIIQQKTVSSEFALRAPADGLVVERIAQLGELVDGGRAFAVLANPAEMWIEARLTDEQIRRVAVGQSLNFTSDGRGLRRVDGEVIWVSPFLDPHTRTGIVRARVVDQSHPLRAGEFGRVSISENRDEQAILIPKDAVQWEGCCNIVFVKEAVDRFRPRKIQLASARGPYYQAVEGLRPGEEVVVNGSFLLKTELMKTSIGAGCCGIEAEG